MECWLKEVMELWLTRVWDTPKLLGSDASSELESGKAYLSHAFHFNLWTCLRSLEVGQEEPLWMEGSFPPGTLCDFIWSS